MQAVLDNTGTLFEEVESSCLGAHVGQHIRVVQSARPFDIPYPLAQVEAQIVSKVPSSKA